MTYQLLRNCLDCALQDENEIPAWRGKVTGHPGMVGPILRCPVSVWDAGFPENFHGSAQELVVDLDRGVFYLESEGQKASAEFPLEFGCGIV
jgi:hypothetical protein